MKKVISCILSLVLAAAILNGCGKKKTENSPYNPDVPVGDTGGLEMPITLNGEELTWSVNATNHTDETLNNCFVVNRLREITGVNVKIMALPLAAANDKIKVLAAAKKLPDIVGQGIDEKVKNDLCVQGAFAAVEDYLDVLPNFRKIFYESEDASWVPKSYPMSDGKVYSFFGWDWARDINTGATLYRKDIFDKHGLKMWNSPEEFYQTLKKLKELYPESTPYAVKTTEETFKNWSYSWGMVAQNPYYDEEEKIWKYTDTDPKYREMLDFMKKCYDEGLIDPEFLTTNEVNWTHLMTQADKAFVTTDWIGRIRLFKNQTLETVPDYDLRFGNPIGPRQTMLETSQLCTPKHVSNNKNAEIGFKLLDFVISPAGAELITMGAEGETYVLDENGMAKYIGFESDPSTTELNAKYGMFQEGMYLRYDRRCTYFKFTPAEQEAQDFAKDKSHLEKRDPVLPFNNDLKTKTADYLAALNKAGKEFATKYVLGSETGDAAWEKWQQEAKRLGSEELVKIYNEEQKKYDAQK